MTRAVLLVAVAVSGIGCSGPLAGQVLSGRYTLGKGAPSFLRVDPMTDPFAPFKVGTMPRSVPSLSLPTPHPSHVFPASAPLGFVPVLPAFVPPVIPSFVPPTFVPPVPIPPVVPPVIPPLGTLGGTLGGDPGGLIR